MKEQCDPSPYASPVGSPGSPPGGSSRAWSPCGDIRKVLVVGAGPAGLQAAKHLRQAGYAVLLLEAEDDVGGAWLRNYYGLQGICRGMKGAGGGGRASTCG